MAKKTRFVLGPTVFLAILMAIGAVLIHNVMLHGFSARTPPTVIEKALATPKSHNPRKDQTQ